jgi:pyridoxine 4-dehydrogenase
VQTLFNLFIPWFPLATGRWAGAMSPRRGLAEKQGVWPSRLALAWLLGALSRHAPDPRTANVSHLEDNGAAAEIKLTDEESSQLDAIS